MDSAVREGAVSLAEYAAFRRCFDFYAADPTFRALAEKDPSGAVDSLGFTGLVDPGAAVTAIRCILFARAPDTVEKVRRGNAYLQEFLKRTGRASSAVLACQQRSCYRETWLYQYEVTTRNRCRMECAAVRAHPFIWYFPVCFELSSGCTVQCPFCGFSAPLWKGNFDYSEENRALFRSILAATMAFIGPVMKEGPLYFATEPLDHPAYERILQDYREVIGDIPQTTTALAEKDPKRVRALIRVIGQEKLKEGALRFSIRTLPQFKRIMASYTPEELVDIEVLANNPESVNRYAGSGREAERAVEGGQHISGGGRGAPLQGKTLRYSIDCIAGLRVSLADRTISFVEPRLPGPEFPTGVLTRETVSFENAADYEKKMRALLTKYAIGVMPRYRRVCINREVTVTREGSALHFSGDGAYLRIKKSAAFGKVLSGLLEGRIFSAICEAEGLTEADAAAVYESLNALYLRGYLVLG